VRVTIAPTATGVLRGAAGGRTVPASVARGSATLRLQLRARRTLVLTYPGDAATRPQRARLRLAAAPSRLTLTSVSLRGGRLRARGRIAATARGRVAITLQYDAGGSERALATTARIRAGRWSVDIPAPADVPLARSPRCVSVAFAGSAAHGLMGGLRSRGL
jgi:hypothetical protein